MTALVLKQDVGRDQIAEVLRKLALVLHPTSPPEELFWQIWMTPDEKSAVHYIEESRTKVRYFTVRGRKRGMLAKKIGQALPVWTRDELLKHALFLLIEGSDDDRQRVAMEVACEMGEDEYDPASAGVLQAFLEMDEPSIRRAGARAFRRLPRPVFRSTAEELAVDSDPEIAAVGEEMLTRIKEVHGDG